MKNYLLEETLLVEQQLKNRELEKCYSYIVETVSRISNLLDNESVKGIIKTDHREFPGTEATIFECITPYCCVSLGADDTGYYNINYSIDYRATEMIGEYALTSLLRNIYRFTMNNFTDTVVEQRVWIHSLAYEIKFDEIKAVWNTESNREFATFSN
ncbi:hypothetical protein GZH53_15805 [Flavihumibacter sp. R14]|nr:hypothetical protein [Flavihumibacter soli]